MRILVTGATGFVGRAVTRALLADGHDVLALVRTPAKAADLEATGAALAVGEMLRPDTYVPKVSEVDAVVHTAQYGTSGRLTRAKLEQVKAADEIMTKALAQACLEQRKRLVYTSGCFNYGDHGDAWITETTPETPSPLGEGHHDLTNYLLGLHQQDGLEVIILAPGFVYGPGGLFKTSFYDLLHKGQLRVFGKGKNFWSPVHVDDLARAYVRAVERDVSGDIAGEVVNVVDNEPLRLRELIDTFTDAASRPRVGSVPPWLLGLAIGGPLVTSLTTSFRVRNDKAERVLGWTPTFRSFRDGIPQVLQQLGS